MVLELTRAISFMLCILSLYSVMLSAFFIPGARWQQLLIAAILRVAIAAAVCFATGLLFLHQPAAPTTANKKSVTHSLTHSPAQSLTSTLPVRLFFWSLAAMAILFLLTWYLETYYLPLLKNY